MSQPHVREAGAEDSTLRQTLPPLFARMAVCFLGDGEEPLATVFTPPRALVLIARGVLFMEESEAGFPSPCRGIKSLFYRNAQITVVETDTALLPGRFLLQGLGDAPIYEIVMRPENPERFRAVARLIGEKIAGGGL